MEFMRIFSILALSVAGVLWPLVGVSAGQSLGQYLSRYPKAAFLVTCWGERLDLKMTYRLEGAELGHPRGRVQWSREAVVDGVLRDVVVLNHSPESARVRMEWEPGLGPVLSEFDLDFGSAGRVRWAHEVAGSSRLASDLAVFPWTGRIACARFFVLDARPFVIGSN